MEKRTLPTEKDASPRPSKQAHTDQDIEQQPAVRSLTAHVFGQRSTTLQARAIELITQDPSSTPQQFATQLRAFSHTITTPTIASLWRSMREWFEDDKRPDLGEFSGVVDVQTLVATLKSAPLDVTSLIETTEEVAPTASAPLPLSRPESSSSPTSGTSSRSRPSSSTMTSSTLRSAAANKMKEEFRKNFQSFKGAPWTLPSTVVVDDLLASHVETLRKESSLHSFVINDVETLLNLITEEDDKEMITKVLVTRSEEALPLLSPDESAYVGLFNKKPDELEELLANGWGSTRSAAGDLDEEFKRVWLAIEQIHLAYWEQKYELPESQSESWYVQGLWVFLGTLLRARGILKYQPGEVCSAASTLRKNRDRSLESRQLTGRKVDGLIRCATAGLEICVIEAAKCDNGPNGTKALSDTRKLSKSMKDMHDAIRNECLVNVRDELVTFGIRISAASITFYTLRQRPGRFYQLSFEDSASFPPVWDLNGGNTPRVLNVVSSVLRFKKQMLEMARNIQVWTTPAFDGTKQPPVNDEWAATLTTPLNSPRLSPTSL